MLALLLDGAVVIVEWKGAVNGDAWDENAEEGGALGLAVIGEDEKGREGAALRFRERTKTWPDSVQMMIVPSAPSAASCHTTEFTSISVLVILTKMTKGVRA